MLYGKALDQLIDRIPTLDKGNSTDRERAGNAFNLANAEVYRAANWEFRKKSGQIILIPNYTTGTCSITKFDGTNDQSSRTVIFVGSSLTQGMVGRYFQPLNSSQWYKIVYISGNTAYLDTPVVDATASNATFIIWKRFYYVKSEVDGIVDFGSWETGEPLDYKSSTGLTDSASILSSVGSPQVYSPYGIDPADDASYSVGSISIAEDSNIVVGVGTSFFANADSGDILTVGEVEYTIKSPARLRAAHLHIGLVDHRIVDHEGNRRAHVRGDKVLLFEQGAAHLGERIGLLALRPCDEIEITAAARASRSRRFDRLDGEIGIVGIEAELLEGSLAGSVGGLLGGRARRGVFEALGQVGRDQFFDDVAGSVEVKAVLLVVRAFPRRGDDAVRLGLVERRVGKFQIGHGRMSPHVGKAGRLRPAALVQHGPIRGRASPWTCCRRRLPAWRLRRRASGTGPSDCPSSGDPESRCGHRTTCRPASPS